MTLAVLLRRSVAQTWYLLAAAMLVLGGFQLVLVAQAAALLETRAYGMLAEYIPAFLQRGIGGDAMLLATFRGTVAFGYFHPIVLIVFAGLTVYYAVESAYEIESGLVDVVLARPFPRRRLLTRSVVLLAAVPVVMAATMALGTWAGLQWFAPDTAEQPGAAAIGRLIVNLIAVTWCVGAMALALATRVRRWSVAFGTVAIGAVVLYLVDFLAIGWPLWRNIAWISPFHYFPALRVFSGSQSMLPDVAVLLVAAMFFVGFSYWQFNRRDL
jgi:ABC-type transport system involved in multi-copper enzyme maturation permease subunit